MTPKTPDELKEQIESQPAAAEPRHERTSEGLETPTPSEDDFFANLEKASKPDDDQ